MVHVSDAIVAPWLMGFGWVLSAGLLAYGLAKMNMEDIPKLSVITAAVFVASLIHFQVGPTSVHLVLNGFAGVTLGVLSVPCLVVSIIMQCFLFQHGGVTTIGLNALNMGAPALIAFLIFRTGMGLNFDFQRKEVLFGSLAGGIAVALSVMMLAVELLITGSEFTEVTTFVVFAHIPVIIIEAIFTGVMAGFFAKVKPDMLCI
ncbi:MAG: cobalt transporter CbiM [Methanosarcinales archaeon]|nr:cobalt transporter CbiM [Methanosarcinales archaeon]